MTTATHPIKSNVNRIAALSEFLDAQTPGTSEQVRASMTGARTYPALLLALESATESQFGADAITNIYAAKFEGAELQAMPAKVAAPKITPEPAPVEIAPTAPAAAKGAPEADSAPKKPASVIAAKPSATPARTVAAATAQPPLTGGVPSWRAWCGSARYQATCESAYQRSQIERGLLAPPVATEQNHPKARTAREAWGGRYARKDNQ